MATATAAPPAPAAEASDIGTVARLGAKASKFKSIAKKQASDLEQAQAKVTELEKKLADLEKSGGAQRIAELELKLKEVGHRSKFNDAAKAAGADERALDDIWEKSGYKAEGDTPDEGKIKAAIESVKTNKPFFFKADGQQATEQPQIVPGPGRGQGGTAPNDAGPLGITQAQLRDPNWCRQNQAAIQKAAQKALNLPISQVASSLAIL